MIPALTFSVRRALSVGIIFIMFSHSENDHFALARKQPLRERTVFGKSFRDLLALLPGVFVTLGKPQYHLHDSHAVAMVFNLNIY